jgi:hypothetical protein
MKCNAEIEKAYRIIGEASDMLKTLTAKHKRSVLARRVEYARESLDDALVALSSVMPAPKRIRKSDYPF